MSLLRALDPGRKSVVQIFVAFHRIVQLRWQGETDLMLIWPGVIYRGMDRTHREKSGSRPTSSVGDSRLTGVLNHCATFGYAASKPTRTRKAGCSRSGIRSVPSTIRQCNRRAVWNGPFGAHPRRFLPESA